MKSPSGCPSHEYGTDDVIINTMMTLVKIASVRCLVCIDRRFICHPSRKGKSRTYVRKTIDTAIVLTLTLIKCNAAERQRRHWARWGMGEKGELTIKVGIGCKRKI